MVTLISNLLKYETELILESDGKSMEFIQDIIHG